MKYWLLIDNLDENAKKIAVSRGSAEVFDAAALTGLLSEMTGKDIRVLDSSKASVEIRDGEKIRVFYDNQPVSLPDAVWTLFPGNDLFAFEYALQRAGVDLLADYCLYRQSEKSLSYQILAENAAGLGVRVPHTLVFYPWPRLEPIVEKLGYPFVLKPTGGHGGAGVELIHNEAEFAEYLKSMDSNAVYVAQEYIATSKGKDVRAAFFKGQYLFSVQRQASSPDEFRSNTAVGGKMTLYELDEETKARLGKVALLFDFPVVGLDLLFTGREGEFMIAEVNSTPGIFSNETLAAIMGGLVKAYEDGRGPA